MDETASDKAAARTSRHKRERWWWLALFLIVSLALHLGAGYESRGWHLLGGPTSTATPPPGEIEVVLGPTPTKSGDAAKTVPQHAPVPTPAKKVEQPRPVVRKAPPVRIVKRPAPPPSAPPQKPVERTRPKELDKPTRTPSPARRVRGGGESIKIAPTPRKIIAPISAPHVQRVLPSATPPPTPAPVGVAEAPKTLPALPPKLGQSGAPTAPPVTAPTQTAPATAVKGGPAATVAAPPVGTQKPGNPGAPVAGPSNRVGLNRGIPFGTRTGLTNGLPPGEGVGPDGQPTGVQSGYVNGVFHVRLGRPTAASLGLAPAHIVYLLDVSGSMVEDNKIGLAREALRTAVGELLPDDSFAFVTFSYKPHAYSDHLLNASAFNISTQKSNVDIVQPNGGTDLSDAIDLALGMDGVTHIFVISDGEPNIGITKPDDLSAHLKDKNPGAGVHISVFALGDGEQFDGVKLLRRVAEENAGEYRYINDKQSFTK